MVNVCPANYQFISMRLTLCSNREIALAYTSENIYGGGGKLISLNEKRRQASRFISMFFFIASANS